MEKCVYETPMCEVYEMELEGAVLNSSLSSLSTNEGFTREEEIGWN